MHTKLTTENNQSQITNLKQTKSTTTIKQDHYMLLYCYSGIPQDQNNHVLSLIYNIIRGSFENTQWLLSPAPELYSLADLKQFMNTVPGCGIPNIHIYSLVETYLVPMIDNNLTLPCKQTTLNYMGRFQNCGLIKTLLLRHTKTHLFSSKSVLLT